MKKIKLTLDEVKIRNKELYDDKFEILYQTVVNKRTKMTIKCNICGTIFNRELGNHVHNKNNRPNNCPNCTDKKRLTIDDIRNRSNVDLYFIPNQEFKNNKSVINILCKKCNRVFPQKICDHLNKHYGCPTCLGTHKTTIENIRKECFNVHGDIYEIPNQEYINNSTKLSIFCKKCNTFFNKTKTGLISSKQGCTNCKVKSKGEKLIEKYLINNNILFIEEKRFDDCKDKRKLPFDFYLPKQNVCIEFDGEQHTKIVKRWEGEIGLKIRQHRDNIKTNYCNENNIKLLRIRHNENIIEKLNNLL